MEKLGIVVCTENTPNQRNITFITDKSIAPAQMVFINNTIYMVTNVQHYNLIYTLENLSAINFDKLKSALPKELEKIWSI
jgi:hypothetical protein